MTPVPVVAAKNTSTAAEGKIMIADEELERTIQEISENLDKLSSSEKPLTEEEKKYRARLVKRQDILSRIKVAREKNQKDEEIISTAVYDLLVPWGERHPFLMGLMAHFMRVKWASGLTSTMLRDSGKQKEK